MLERLRERVTQVLAHVELRLDPELDQALQPPAREMHETRQDPAFAEAEGESAPRPVGGGSAGDGAPVRSRQGSASLDPRDPATWGRVARNAPCPCGSGKKYKHCQGRMA